MFVVCFRIPVNPIAVSPVDYVAFDDAVVHFILRVGLLFGCHCFCFVLVVLVVVGT